MVLGRIIDHPALSKPAAAADYSIGGLRVDAGDAGKSNPKTGPIR